MVNISSNMSSLGTFGTFKPPSPPKKSFMPYLVIIIAVLILGAGYYLFAYQGVNFSLAAPTISVAPSLTSVEMKVSQLSQLQFDVFDSPFYKSLKSYGALPVKADLLGRINPFIPY